MRQILAAESGGGRGSRTRGHVDSYRLLSLKLFFQGPATDGIDAFLEEKSHCRYSLWIFGVLTFKSRSVTGRTDVIRQTKTYKSVMYKPTNISPPFLVFPDVPALYFKYFNNNNTVSPASGLILITNRNNRRTKNKVVLCKK